MTTILPPPTSLPALRSYLETLASDSLRHAFEQLPDPGAGVEFRRLFEPGDSDEPLCDIPPAEIARLDPHPYQVLGAPYRDQSPFCLRQTVVEKLRLAQSILGTRQPGWTIGVFDAWRPLAVQQFMVDHAFRERAEARGLGADGIDAGTRADLWQEVFTIWSRPVDDPALAPPHSTGAAVDITLLDQDGLAVAMGSAIDAFGPVSRPDHFASVDTDAGREAHRNRSLLNAVMAAAGFQRHPYEWWHFSWGDQLWALMGWLDQPMVYPEVVYGGLGL